MPAPSEPTRTPAWTQLTEVDCIEVLEVRRSDDEREVTITAAIAADALQAICMALSEQLDRSAQDRTENAEEVLTLREHTALVERLRPLVASEGHAVFPFSHAELQTCLLELMGSAERVDDERYQPPELRARMRVLRYVIPVLWEANTAAAETSEGCTREAGQRPRR